MTAVQTELETPPRSLAMPRLERRKLGILGFDAVEAAALAQCLAASGALSRSLHPVSAAADPSVTRFLDLLILNAGGPLPLAARAGKLAGAGELPVLLIGSPQETGAWGEAFRDRPHAAVTRPYVIDNLLLSIHSLLVKTDEKSLGGSAVPATVLVADDDPRITSLLRAVLTSLHFNCQVAHDGREALHLIRTTLPDLVYLDVNMPGISGWDVLQAVRSDPATRATLVAFLSGCGEPDDIWKGSRLHANDYVVKPFGMLDLSARTKRLLRRR